MKNTQTQSQHLNDSDLNSQYMEQTRNKIETIRQSLMKFDKDLDDEIDQEELLNFLDSNMKNGKKFDRGLARKIFEALDLNKNGKITSEEFIKNYISIEEEIKTHIKELQNKYFAEKDKNSQLNRSKMENQNEKLNQYGIGQNGKITIEIYSIEFLKPIFDRNEKISIRILFGNLVNETRELSGEENLVIWKEKFEFKVIKKDILYFQVVYTDEDNNKEVIGSVKFPLDKIEKQEEYDLELEIPDENDERIINAKINAKINFIWSIYKYYQDLHTKSEKALQNYQAMLQKSNKLLENLNEPFKYVEYMENKEQYENSSPEIKNPSVIRQKVEVQKLDLNNKQYEVADKVENFIKNTINQPNIQWMGLIQLFIIANILLGYLNTLARSDFLNLMIPTIIIVIFYTSINKNVIFFLNLFLGLIAGTLLYDFMWIIFCSSAYIKGTLHDGGNENSLKFFVFLTSLISFIVKFLLGISIWIQKLKFQRSGDEHINKSTNLNESSGNIA